MAFVQNTPGPWEWREAGSEGRCMLVTPDRGQLIVMDFVRLGMNGAQPRFATWTGADRGRMGGVMRPATELTLSEHPDARLIPAAPDLLRSAMGAWHRCQSLLACPGATPDLIREVADALLAAITKAQG